MSEKVSNITTEKKLMALQDLYLANRDVKHMQDMFLIVLPYARSSVLKKIRGRTFLNEDLVYEYAVDATIKFMSQYENPEFKVDTSFGGLLGLKVLEAMHGPKVIKADQIGSLNDHIENGKS